MDATASTPNTSALKPMLSKVFEQPPPESLQKFKPYMKPGQTATTLFTNNKNIVNGGSASKQQNVPSSGRTSLNSNQQ